MPPTPEHFQGKSIVEHLREARMRGMMASKEIHGTELPGSISAGADAAKETAIALLILWILSHHLAFPQAKLFFAFLLFSCGWLIWKAGRSALLGWARMERLHRLIEEERWEIEHHRAQERSELVEMYRAKGLQGKLLDEVIEVLMADDNRLLRVMLEEELGLTIEAYEHPLQHSAGAALGVIATLGLCLLGEWLSPSLGLPLVAAVCIGAATALAAKLERNHVINALVWNFSVAALAAGVVHFTAQILFG